jgi:hypothetical protein
VHILAGLLEAIGQVTCADAETKGGDIVIFKKNALPLPSCTSLSSLSRDFNWISYTR